MIRVKLIQQEFDKLMIWLDDWNQYTNIKQIGTTNQFFQHIDKPLFKFSELDD